MKILLTGCGKMGRAFLEAILLSAIKKEDITIIDPNAKIKNIKVFKQAAAVPAAYKADLIIYAVKPLMIEQSAAETKKFLKAGGFVFSIAAGKTVKDFQKILGAKTAVVRAMPNLPMSVGAGVSGMFASKNVTAKQKSFCNKILKNAGLSFWVKKEEDINKVIAVAGSAPAYFYAVVNALESAALSYGFNKKLAREIAQNILIGSAKLLQHSGLNAQQLNKNIATPGGTTEAALKVLAKNKALDKLIKSAADAAKTRFS